MLKRRRRNVIAPEVSPAVFSVLTPHTPPSGSFCFESATELTDCAASAALMIIVLKQGIRICLEFTVYAELNSAVPVLFYPEFYHDLRRCEADWVQGRNMPRLPTQFKRHLGWSDGRYNSTNHNTCTMRVCSPESIANRQNKHKPARTKDIIV